jgi:uncharacterized protein YndB with AHSA1/START domain
VPPCRPETLGFTAVAPLRTTVTRDVEATPSEVFDALADPSAWVAWFPGMTGSRWTSEAPHGVGSTRQVQLGPLTVDEQFLVWEPAQRFAFTFTATNLPVARAGVELLELVPRSPTGTRVAYTFAVDPTGVPGPLARTAVPVVRAVVSRGLAGLDAHLAAR